MADPVSGRVPARFVVDVDRAHAGWARRLGRRFQRLAPASRLVLSFLFLVLIGTGLLLLPWVPGQAGHALRFVDALFVSTSAVCVTGLCPLDIGAEFGFFGQAAVLFLIQMGGLGFLTLSTGLLLGLGGRASLLSRATLAETFSHRGHVNLRRLLQAILLFTFLSEFLGAAVLTWRFHTLHEGSLSWGEALWRGVFHAISAFCNAGFSLQSDSLMPYADDPWIVGTAMVLIVLGGLGFLVVYDLYESAVYAGPRRKLSLHTQIALSTTAVLLASGAALCFFLESQHAPPGDLSVPDALFLSVTARTAGFNTVDTGALSSPTLMLLIALMFVGGSPASCAGGTKTTTTFVLAQVVFARLARRRHAAAFGRQIGAETVMRAATLVLVSVIFVGLSFGLLLMTESGRFPARCEGGVAMDIAFETVSAFGTVGLSTGITAHLSDPGKLLLVALMFLGRLGPLTIFVALANPPRLDKVRFPEESVLVG